jgi:hypothetical protein
MAYIRVDTGNSYTIIEWSSDPIDNLLPNEVQATTDFNFPTGQPIFFWKYDMMLFQPVPNDQAVIDGYYNNPKLGFDLDPHIDRSENAELEPLQQKDIEIYGNNFSPFTVIEVTGEGNFVNTTEYKSPQHITANVTASPTEGLYNIIATNNELTSDESGFNEFKVKAKTTVDLRTADYGLLGIQQSAGLTITQDPIRGMRVVASSSSWNRGIKFGNTWQRSENLTFEMVFTRTDNTLFMAGIGSEHFNVNSLSNIAYYRQEIGFYHNNNRCTSLYGGAAKGSWSQVLPTAVQFDTNTFYKLKLERAGEAGALCSFSEVDPNNWDDEEVILTWTSNCIAEGVTLAPIIVAQSTNGEYFITGYRF